MCAALLALAAAAPATHVVRSLDLRAPFRTSSAWQVVVTQEPDEPDSLGMDDKAPGVMRACLSRDDGVRCQPYLLAALREPGDGPDPYFAEPHELQRLSIVHPAPGEPMLLVRLASLHSGDGDQRVATLLLRYDRDSDRFVPAYRRLVGHNNNQEVRYVEAGPLAGAVIAAAPTTDAPFGFWMTVDRLGADGGYRSALRYRSATRYNDGNHLKVIDSEMPAIEQRLGLWHPGQPLPHSAHCPSPRLVKMELWCGPVPSAPR